MAENRGELISVIHLFRHGERGPLTYNYPNDPYKNHSYEPIKKEVLTNKGKKHMYELGQSVRERYRDFLPSSYSFKDYRIYTSEKERTIVSAQLYSAGLFPPTDTEIWDEDIKWNPIPTYMTEQPVMRDFPHAFCPAYLRALKPLVDDLWEKCKDDPVVQTIVSHSGVANDFEELCYVEQTIKSQVAFGLKAPDWAKEILPNMKFVIEFANVMIKTDEMKKLFMGCLLNEIVQHFKKMQANPSSGPKLITYSGHDTTIMNILSILGTFEQKVPVFGGGVYFELWKKNEEFYVNIYYQREDIEPLTIEGAEFDFKFDEFIEFLSRYAISQDEFYRICS